MRLFPSVRISLFWLVLTCQFSIHLHASPKEDECCWIPMGLPELEKRLKRDLELVNYPPRPWRETSNLYQGLPFYDVVIIGGGYSGMTASFALFKVGVTNQVIFDCNPQGLEGPWLNYARMKTLRSGKGLMGPALFVPSLTFRAWFEALYGYKAWSKLYRTPTEEWMEYLRWYRKVLRLPINNLCVLKVINPEDGKICLEIEDHGVNRRVYAKKVVLATGRDGFGGLEIPAFVNALPKEYWAHSSDYIDVDALENKRIAVIGVGASGFDAAAVALENNCESVIMLMRRSHLPNVNKFAEITLHGFYEGFYNLEDQQRWAFLNQASESGIPPPVEAIERVIVHHQFHLLPDIAIREVTLRGSKVEIDTNQGSFVVDYVILGTGFELDGKKQCELQSFMDKVLLWSDRNVPDGSVNKWGKSPYLGPHFEFLEKEPGNKIIKMIVGQRGTHICPHCQRPLA